MRSIIPMLIISICFMPLKSYSQQAETLFGNDIDHGGFGSLIYGVTSVNGQAAYLRGTRGAWVIRFRDGHSVNLGLAGYRTRSNFDVVNWPNADAQIPEMRTNYGGFEAEYVNRSFQLIHFGVQTWWVRELYDIEMVEISINHRTIILYCSPV